MERVTLKQGINYVGGTCVELNATQASIAEASEDNTPVVCGVIRMILAGDSVVASNECPLTVNNPMTAPEYAGHCVMTCDVAIMPRRFMEVPPPEAPRAP